MTFGPYRRDFVQWLSARLNMLGEIAMTDNDMATRQLEILARHSLVRHAIMAGIVEVPTNLNLEPKRTFFGRLKNDSEVNLNTSSLEALRFIEKSPTGVAGIAYATEDVKDAYATIDMENISSEERQQLAYAHLHDAFQLASTGPLQKEDLPTLYRSVGKMRQTFLANRIVIIPGRVAVKCYPSNDEHAENFIRNCKAMGSSMTTWDGYTVNLPIIYTNTKITLPGEEYAFLIMKYEPGTPIAYSLQDSEITQEEKDQLVRRLIDVSVGIGVGLQQGLKEDERWYEYRYDVFDEEGDITKSEKGDGPIVREVRRTINHLNLYAGNEHLADTLLSGLESMDELGRKVTDEHVITMTDGNDSNLLETLQKDVYTRLDFENHIEYVIAQEVWRAACSPNTNYTFFNDERRLHNLWLYGTAVAQLYRNPKNDKLREGIEKWNADDRGLFEDYLTTVLGIPLDDAYTHALGVAVKLAFEHLRYARCNMEDVEREICEYQREFPDLQEEFPALKECSFHRLRGKLDALTSMNNTISKTSQTEEEDLQSYALEREQAAKTRYFGLHAICRQYKDDLMYAGQLCESVLEKMGFDMAEQVRTAFFTD